MKNKWTFVVLAMGVMVGCATTDGASQQKIETSRFQPADTEDSSVSSNSNVPDLVPVSYTMKSGEQSKDYMLLTLQQVKETVLPNNISPFGAELGVLRGFREIGYREVSGVLIRTGESICRIASDVFIKIEIVNDRKYLYLCDSDGERISEGGRSERTYNILDNDDYDEGKIYRVYYICELDIENHDSFLVGRFKRINSIDFIEGLAPYAETLVHRREADNEIRNQELAQKKAEIEKAYSDALSSTGTASIIEYIENYRGKDGFNEDSYAEIGRRITRNRNIEFERIINAPNPYAFNVNTVYYCSGLIIQNSIRGQLIVSMPNLFRGEISLIVLGNVPDVIKLGDYITNAYLKYTGITTVSMNNGSTRELATFTVIFNF
jgi:hypothetical protein